MKRAELAELIVNRLEAEKPIAAQEYSTNKVNSFIVDNLLPEKVALDIHTAFPSPSVMRMKKSLREYKYIAVQMDQYNPILEEAIYAFQDSRVVKIIEEITGLASLIPDENLYAGGISLMDKGKYLNPHLDNSHDKERQLYRVLNLLYYVTPNWKQEYGGNLELWDDGPKGTQRTIHSRFNRLAVMVTHQKSWHSVSQVCHDGSRCCISNYYFSAQPVGSKEYFHVTSFRGRPEQPLRDLILRGDATLRMSIRHVFKKGIIENPHVYKK